MLQFTHTSVIRLLAAASLLAAPLAAHAAGEITMEGAKYTTNGYLYLNNPSQPIHLNDADGNDVKLEQYTDRTMLVRFIPKPNGRPSEIQIARSGQGKKTILVPGGFGSDIKNFNIPAWQLGQNYGLRGASSGWIRSESPYQTSRSCSYVCGSQVVCRDVNESVCRVDASGRRVCTNVPRRVCEPQTRYCSGSQRIQVYPSTRHEEFHLMIEYTNGSPAGHFVANDDETTSTEVELTSCF